jgi:hypothetical protein
LGFCPFLCRTALAPSKHDRQPLARLKLECPGSLRFPSMFDVRCSERHGFGWGQAGGRHVAVLRGFLCLPTVSVRRWSGPSPERERGISVTLALTRSMRRRLVTRQKLSGGDGVAKEITSRRKEQGHEVLNKTCQQMGDSLQLPPQNCPSHLEVLINCACPKRARECHYQHA